MLGKFFKYGMIFCLSVLAVLTTIMIFGVDKYPRTAVVPLHSDVVDVFFYLGLIMYIAFCVDTRDE